MFAMRHWHALALALTACSYDPSPSGDDDDMPDGPMAYVLPEPRLIPGGTASRMFVSSDWSMRRLSCSWA